MTKAYRFIRDDSAVRFLVKKVPEGWVVVDRYKPKLTDAGILSDSDGDPCFHEVCLCYSEADANKVAYTLSIYDKYDWGKKTD